jgi:hypothetical protein
MSFQKDHKLQKGHKKLGGRKKGTPNKIQAGLKDAILAAAAQAGHDEGLIGYLQTQAVRNPGPFLGLLGRVLPHTIVGDADNPIKTITEIRHTIVRPHAAELGCAAALGITQINGVRSANKLGLSNRVEADFPFFEPNPIKERARRVVTNLALTTACSGGLKGRGPENNVCRIAPFLFSQYIARMLSRVRNSRGRPINAPAAFIHPCRPIVVAEPPTGPGWGARTSMTVEAAPDDWRRALLQSPGAR